MRRMLTAIMLATVLTACATPLASTADAIDRAESAYLRARPLLEFALSIESPERSAQILAAMTAIEDGLAAARAATSIADRVAALAQIEDAMRAIATEPDEAQDIQLHKV